MLPKPYGTSTPLVSIITPVRNGVKYLEACIESILSQNYFQIEHILVDGASTDGTLGLLKTYSTQYRNRIKFISEPDNGTGEAWNKGIKMAKGQILGELSADDISHPGAIKAVVDFFNANPDAHFVFGGCNFINSDGEVTGKIQTKDFDLNEILNEGCYVPTPSSFYRREVFDKVGYYEPSGNDLDYLLRVAQVFKIYRIEDTLSNFRIHEQSATSGRNVSVRKQWLYDDCRVSRKYGGKFWSGYRKRYYQFVLVETLRPVFGFVYPMLRTH